MRVQDRRGPNGEKILHVEEIQSDWHQEGRKKGYATKERLENWYNQNKLEGDPAFSDLSNEQLNVLERNRSAGMGGDNAVPDAPFKKNWHELAMKRLLNYAADQGYDSIAITPGAEQAKRFNLRNRVEQVSYTPATKNLMAFDRSGNAVVNESNVNPEDLEKYLGVGVTERLNQAEFEGPSRVLRGESLEVGGEGMKGFYDQILPNYLNTFGKSYGAKVEPMSIDMGGFKVNRDSYPLPYRLELANSPDIISRFATAEEAWAEAQRMGQMPLHNFRITPEMRESIKQKGLPLYQQVGIPTAGAGAASQMLEPEEEAGLAGGGSVAKMAALAKLAKMREEMTPRAEAVKALIAKDENKYLRDVTPNSLTNAEIEAEIARMKARAEASQPEVKKAVGGAINFDTAPDMSDEGRMIQGAPFKRGGKVNMTANRDTMFLELSNKKLKRK
jgi:hypothetical protein